MLSRSDRWVRSGVAFATARGPKSFPGYFGRRQAPSRRCHVRRLTQVRTALHTVSYTPRRSLLVLCQGLVQRLFHALSISIRLIWHYHLLPTCGGCCERFPLRFKNRMRGQSRNQRGRNLKKPKAQDRLPTLANENLGRPAQLPGQQSAPYAPSSGIPAHSADG